jgi:hypothetical protein
MGNMQVVDFYLERCEFYCNSGGYTHLSSRFDIIKKETVSSFPENSSRKIIDVCDKTTREHLETLFHGRRLYDWGFCDEKSLREKINNSL